MLNSIIAVTIQLIQIGVILYSFFFQLKALFVLSFYHLSPVLVFFTLLEKVGINYGGALSQYLWQGLLLCVVKYYFIARAFVVESPNGAAYTALFLEIAYLATSGYHIVWYTYF